MAKKRTSLDAVLPQTTEPPAKMSPSETVAARTTAKPAGRRPNVKQQTLYLPHSAHRTLRGLAFEEDRSQHDLLLEAIDLLFASRGLPTDFKDGE